MPVLIMEFVDGLDLAEIVRRIGPLPMADACELVRQTALALQCAHEHGLVHRDIKPSNIMLTPAGEVKLLDLGLARFYAEGGSGVSPVPAGEEMTGTGQAMGTADYMAPEQASDSRTRRYPRRHLQPGLHALQASERAGPLQRASSTPARWTR